MPVTLLSLVKAQGMRLWPGRHLLQPFIAAVWQALTHPQESGFPLCAPACCPCRKHGRGEPSSVCFQPHWKQSELQSTSREGNPQTSLGSQFSSMQFSSSHCFCRKRNFRSQRARDPIIHSSNLLLYLGDRISGMQCARESPRLITEILSW